MARQTNQTNEGDAPPVPPLHSLAFEKRTNNTKNHRARFISSETYKYEDRQSLPGSKTCRIGIL